MLKISRVMLIKGVVMLNSNIVMLILLWLCSKNNNAHFYKTRITLEFV